jgi:hypothetical protein
MRSDDLVPLLTPARGVPSGPPVGFRQGVIVTWDAETAENTVLVAGAIMENLPILNTSEASILTAGDVVGVLTAGPTWAIMGRFTYPGTPEAVSSISAITNRIQAAADSSSGSRNSITYGDLTGSSVGPSVTATIGSSGRALVLWSAEIGQTGLTHEINPHVGVAVTGATTRAADAEAALNVEFRDATGGQTSEFQAWFQMGTFHLFEGLNPGATTFTLKYRHDGMATSVTFSAREIAVFVL